jgi:hypothetical protein
MNKIRIQTVAKSISTLTQRRHSKDHLFLISRYFFYCNNVFFCINTTYMTNNKNETPWPEYASDLYRPSDRRLSAKLVPTFSDRGCHVVSVADSYGNNLDFLDRSLYLFFQVAPELYSRGWVDPVPDSLFVTKSGGAGNRTRTSGSVARNFDD